MGLIGNLLTAFYLPRPLVLLPPELFLAVPAAWLRAISRHRGTVTAAPNFAFGLCLKRIRDEELTGGVDLSSWRLCLNGAELTNAEVQRRFSERFGPWGFDAQAFTPVYGLAEASLAVTFKPPGSAFRVLDLDDRELVSTGRPPLAASRWRSAVTTPGHYPTARSAHLRPRAERDGRLLRARRSHRSGDP